MMQGQQEENARILKETEEEYQNHHKQYLTIQMKKNKLLDEKVLLFRLTKHTLAPSTNMFWLRPISSCDA